MNNKIIGIQNGVVCVSYFLITLYACMSCIISCEQTLNYVKKSITTRRIMQCCIKDDINFQIKKNKKHKVLNLKHV